MATATTTATEVIEQIHQHGRDMADDRLRKIPEDFPIGQYIPQGDINILRLGGIPDAIARAKEAQLAPGTSRGSRHCIKAEDLAHCDFFSLRNPNPLQGPIIRFNKPTTITHPEHGDQLWPTGVVAITYQRRYAAELKRIQD